MSLAQRIILEIRVFETCKIEIRTGGEGALRRSFLPATVFMSPAARGRAVAAAGEERAPHPAAAVGEKGTVAGGTPAGRRGHRAVPPGAVRPAGAGKMLRLLRTIEIGSRKHLWAW